MLLAEDVIFGCLWRKLITFNYSWLKENMCIYSIQLLLVEYKYMQQTYSIAFGWRECIQLLLDESKYVGDMQKTLWGINAQGTCVETLSIR